MSPTLRPPGEVRLKRTAMSTRELRRVEVLGRVKGQTLRLVDAAKMLEVSYRQAKRLWQRYREEGAKGLQHRRAGRSSKLAQPEKFRRKVLRLIREKYSGTEQERFGPTLAAEHLADEDGLEVGEETLRRWMLAEGLWMPLWERLGKRMTAELEPDSVWVIDDTGFAKQGKHSVGVERQYSGTLGKVGNCQVAVSLHHVGEQGSTVLGWRLYLPESWTKDGKRREAAGVPEEVVFKTKWQLSLDMIDQVRAWGLPNRIVVADAG